MGTSSSVDRLGDTLPCDTFIISFRVRFDNFSNNYPMCVTTETNAMQCHGLGPAYGSRRGRLTVYLHTVSGLGPHGRGIQGDDGCLISGPLVIGKWHSVRIEKTRRSLSLTIDGSDRSICYIPDSMLDSEFDMKIPGRCRVANLEEREHILHGDLSDFIIYRDIGEESRLNSLNTEIYNDRNEGISAERIALARFDDITDRCKSQGDNSLPRKWVVTSGSDRNGSANWQSSQGNVMFHFNPRSSDQQIIHNILYTSFWMLE